MQFKVTATQKGSKLLINGYVITPTNGYAIEFWPLKLSNGCATVSIHVCAPEQTIQVGLGRIDIKREYDIPTLVRTITIRVNDLFSFELPVDQLPL